MQVEFSTFEYNYLARVSGKLLLARKDLSVKEMAKGNNGIIKELAVKFSNHVDVQPSYTVHLKRTHLRFLQEALSHSVVVLDNSVLPEYESRPNKEELVGYIAKLKETRVMLMSMLTRIEAAL